MSKEVIVIYRCNQCKAVLSNPEDNIANPHLSIVIGAHSGWWEPTDINVEGVALEDHWEQTRSIDPGIYHFCDSVCFKQWLVERL